MELCAPGSRSLPTGWNRVHNSDADAAGLDFVVKGPPNIAVELSGTATHAVVPFNITVKRSGAN